ncbi:hypothetical protein DACRYDRAFT_107434 [Dacryopinax primogenitus]|uniref:Uncharacterized protein n=1 Tax=Dacryopinax primogenitus (strain DJM 731) TaxID=1858805 RepID=M5G799_DACPD|nr:uncharacterized protein DACRYDRAFT_107434 [Dacryopinax primogenitus]EJU01687.1 hypothetical protein DACRYDRAFT_107434 [Dacryopinax primogenitus]
MAVQHPKVTTAWVPSDTSAYKKKLGDVMAVIPKDYRPAPTTTPTLSYPYSARTTPQRGTSTKNKRLDAFPFIEPWHADILGLRKNHGQEELARATSSTPLNLEPLYEARRAGPEVVSLLPERGSGPVGRAQQGD